MICLFCKNANFHCCSALGKEKQISNKLLNIIQMCIMHIFEVSFEYLTILLFSLDKKYIIRDRELAYYICMRIDYKISSSFS